MRDIDTIFRELPKLTVNIQQLSTGSKTNIYSTTATAKKLFKQTLKSGYESGLDISTVFKFYISTSQIPNITLKNGDKILSGSDEYKIIECELVDYSASITPFYELLVEKITV
jgi:hypothetical protein